MCQPLRFFVTGNHFLNTKERLDFFFRFFLVSETQVQLHNAVHPIYDEHRWNGINAAIGRDNVCIDKNNRVVHSLFLNERFYHTGTGLFCGNANKHRALRAILFLQFMNPEFSDKQAGTMSPKNPGQQPLKSQRTVFPSSS